MIDKTTANQYTWGQNCNSWVLIDDAALSVKQENMPPGSREQLHFHENAQQFFFILKGSATFYIDKEKRVINEFQGLHIMPGQKHYIANETHHELEFLIISQPSTNTDRFNIH
ncbi:MAG TPA: cupin domain-containing protein [Flavobacteriales bacterium]|nr:cupin domain-containing protein [Flavobacteriales bacterium]